MERKDDPLKPHLHQGRELRQFTEGEAVAPPQKIEHFLRHARAALQRPQPSGISVASLGRARRVLVAPTSSSMGDSSNPFPDTSIESDAGIRMMRDSRSNPTDLVLSERLLENLASRACQANPANLTQQEKFESKRRKGHSDEEADGTSMDSARNMKLFSGKGGNMEAIPCDSEFLHICEPLVSTQRSVVEQSFSASNCPNAINEFKISSCDGVLVGDACEDSSQANHHCKSTLADGLQKVPVSSFNATNLDGTYLAKGSVRNIQCVDSRDASSDKMHPAMVSNNTLMHTDKDAFDPMDTTTLTCGSSSHYNGSIICNQVEPSALNKQVLKDQDYVNQHMIGNNAGAEEVHMGGAGSFEMKNSGMTGGPNEKFIGVTGKEPSNPPTTASSVATATSLQCTPAAPLNSTTHIPSFYRNVSLRCSVREPVGQSDLNGKRFSNQSKAFDNQSDLNILSAASIGMPLASVSQTSGLHDQGLVQRLKPFKQEIVQATDPHSDSVKCLKDNPVHDRGNDVPDAGNAVLISDTKALPSEPRSSSSNTHAVTSVPNPGKLTSEKESAVSRKKHYDADVFFKVNGKLYQKLGRIGTGGSSEVYKVISSDCTIYALKKIKLKGRDYSTAYGFCQEVKYLNRLRGKNNIIQLIDFEVTDKQFLEAAINDVVPVKDGRINDETYIYMVLEYGEIDLAHMLSQKWKEMESSNKEIDQNWLRFYWQQILRAVNTIHDERIVHSDLKPANFLLVKGSLKLIDFGIAKAIQSDTTNIQRDSQVGTLNYMSPEAFLCNEQDSDGNNIKCGRPSDIWSLGCILYQMVYGKTPFAEYKTFWAKFKVITDRNHAINYGPVSNPWLVDLMKKCLAWDRHERWRIPQLLQHPFLAPPMASGISSALGQCRILSQIAEHHGTEPQVSLLCDQLKELIIKLQSGK